MAVDIWILEVRDPSRASRGLAAAFGLPREKCEAIIAALPCCVKRGVKEQEALRYQKQLKTIGAVVSWGPTGNSSPPTRRAEVPPNDPPDEVIEVPQPPPPFEATRHARRRGLRSGRRL